jgi:acyl carrier protein
MVSSELEARLRSIIAEQLGVEEHAVTEKTSFINDLGADSLDLAELFMSFEEEFGMTISEEDAQKIETFGDVLSYLREHHVQA